MLGIGLIPSFHVLRSSCAFSSTFLFISEFVYSQGVKRIGWWKEIEDVLDGEIVFEFLSNENFCDGAIL